MMRRFGRAISALRTPTDPPGPTRLKPLVPHDETPPMPDVPDAGGVVRMPTDTAEPLTAEDMPQGIHPAGQAIDPGEWGACEAKRLRLDADDVVVVRHGAATYMSADALRQLGDQAKTAFPDNRVIFLVGDMDAERLPCTPAAAEAIGKAATAGCAKQTAHVEKLAVLNDIRSRFKEIDSEHPGVPLPDAAREEWLRLNDELEALGSTKEWRRRRVYVLASSPDHVRSFAQDWIAGTLPEEYRRVNDVVDLLASHPIGLVVDHPLPQGTIVVRLARAEQSKYFAQWTYWLKANGHKVRDVEEVAACAL